MGEKRRSAPYSSWIFFGAGAEILEQSMWVRNREGTELSYTGPPACVAHGGGPVRHPYSYSPQILF
jgi:hypothetical protein